METIYFRRKLLCFPLPSIIIFFIEESPLNSLHQLSSNQVMDHANRNIKVNLNGQIVNQKVYHTQRSSLPMPMVIAAANKARSAQKVPTISVVDSYSETMFSLDKNNDEAANEYKNRNLECAGLGLMQVAVAVVSQPNSPRGSPKKANNQRF